VQIPCLNYLDSQNWLLRCIDGDGIAVSGTVNNYCMPYYNNSVLF